MQKLRKRRLPGFALNLTACGQRKRGTERREYKNARHRCSGLLGRGQAIRLLVCEAAEQSVAPDRAAILVLRDTTPLQAARQVNAVGRPSRQWHGIVNP